MFRKTIPEWPRNRWRIRRALRRMPDCPLRIILKTRNDPIFLREWHSHHAAIVGAENLIIADNMSDDPDVIEELEKLAQKSMVFRFHGFHNALHKRDVFGAFYEAVERKCDWTLLLDTDERLIWVEGRNWIADGRLLDRLNALPPGITALPGLLVDNHGPHRDRYLFPQNLDRLAPVLHWGKPAIAAGYRPPGGAQCHNIQFPADIFAAGLPPQLVQLHLNNLNRDQRLRTNREKLVARGICAPDTPYAEIAKINLRNIPNACSVVQRCVQQTARLLSDQPTPSAPTVRLNPNGTLEFPNAAQGEIFDQLQIDGAERLMAAIKAQS